MLCPIIFLHMTFVIKLTFLPTGGLCISPSFGGSVASANAPSVSIIMFTQSNCTAVRGADPEYPSHHKINIFSYFYRIWIPSSSNCKVPLNNSTEMSCIYITESCICVRHTCITKFIWNATVRYTKLQMQLIFIDCPNKLSLFWTAGIRVQLHV